MTCSLALRRLLLRQHLNSVLWCSGVAQALAKAAIQALKLFFIASFDSGDIQASKRRKTQAQSAPGSSSGTNGAVPAAAVTAEPETVYQSWLQRQYQAFVSQLMLLLQAQTSASLQVIMHNVV